MKRLDCRHAKKIAHKFASFGCWVKTGVETLGLEHIEYLPIMDYKNKSISLENITSFDVNKSIQRSLTKALARHGLGLYLYAGEDLPEIEVEKISTKVVKNFDEPDKLYATLLRKYNAQFLAMP